MFTAANTAYLITWTKERYSFYRMKCASKPS